MKVLDVTEVKLEWVDIQGLNQQPWQPYEVPPDHIGCTAIIRTIAIKLGKFTKDDKADEVGIRVLVGMGWEAMCVQLYKDILWQPPVQTLNGICTHADGYGTIVIPDPTPVVDEWKYTAKSIRVPGGKENELKDIRDEWMWNCQMMANIRTHPLYPDVRHGRFHVCWAMNNYTKYTLDEKYYRYLVEYEHQEIERNWTMLENHRDEAIRSNI